MLLKPQFAVAVTTVVMLAATAGCESGGPNRVASLTAGQAAQTAESLILADGAGVWGGALLRRDGGTWLGAALHADDLLGLWRIDDARTVRRVEGELATGYHPDGVAVWDENTFVVAVEGDRRVQFWRIDENDAPVKVADLPSPFPARDVLVGDLDGDGLADVILTPYLGEQVAVLWGMGGLEFSEPTYLPAGRSPWHPVIVDWDGSGRPDLVWAELDTGVVQLARNLGGRAFDVDALHRVEGVTARNLAVGDVNQNGLLDIVVAVEVGGAEVLYRQNDGGFVVEKIAAPVLGYVSAAIMRDGTIILGEEGQVVLVRRGADGWDKRVLPAGSLPGPIELFDVDDDGIDDLVIYNSAGGGIVIQFGPLWERAQPVAPFGQ